MPCCVALRDDCAFIAAGFENSHIYLWHFPALFNSPENRQHEEQISPGLFYVAARKFDLGTKYRLLAHSGSVYSIKFIKDDDLMLSCSEDTTIRLWCLNTKCNLTIYRGHNYPIWSIAVASQGDYFASASMDTTARLWRLDKMCPLRIFCGHDDDVECIEFHPNAKYVATGSADCTVRLWSISDGRMVRLMVGHKNTVLSLSFLPDGKFLASASGDGSIKVWNLATNTVTSDLSVPEFPPQTSVSFSPEQSFVSTCGCDSILRIWRIGVTDFTKIEEIDFKQQFSKIVQTHFSRNNKLFVMGFGAPKDTATTLGETAAVTTRNING